MYCVITDNGPVTGRSLKEVNRKLNSLIEENEFRQLGSDRIIILTEQNLEFVQDKKRMSRIPIEKLFRKNSTITLMLGIIMLIEFILLIKK